MHKPNPDPRLVNPHILGLSPVLTLNAKAGPGALAEGQRADNFVGHGWVIGRGRLDLSATCITEPSQPELENSQRI